MIEYDGKGEPEHVSEGESEYDGEGSLNMIGRVEAASVHPQ